MIGHMRLSKENNTIYTFGCMYSMIFLEVMNRVITFFKIHQS